MKVKLDDEVLFEIDERMVKLIAHDIIEPLEDIKRRLRYIIEHKCDQCFARLQKEWLEKLSNDPSIDSIPSKKAAFVDLVLAHPEYKNRSQREKESV